MNISGIRPGLGQINYIPQINPSEHIKTASTAQPQGSASSEVNKISEEEISAARSKQTFGAYDYANAYKPGQKYDMKGAESDINSLDVQQAVTEMRRDSALQQYQYFVGNQNSSSDLSVASIRGAEDFSL